VTAPRDDHRVEVDLDDEQHGYSLGERLRALDLDDEARARLGKRVIVSRDGPKVFLYAGERSQAEQAERIVRDLIAADDLSADVRLTRWHPVEQAWKDASIPLPQTEEERRAEYERREATEAAEAEAEAEYDWHVQAELPSRDEALDLARELTEAGMPVAQRWRYIVLGALTEEEANELAERLRTRAPAGTDVRVEVNPSGLPGASFFFFA
jgi:hypothetical protein